jgi:GDP-L-fucose synthase
MDGTPRKLMDSSKINKLGWNSKISLSEGLNITIEEFIKKISQ